MTSIEPAPNKMSDAGLKRLLVATLMCGGAAALWGGHKAAYAGDWTLTDSLTTSVFATDRDGRNEASGLVFQARPRISLTGVSGRSTANVNYELSVTAGTGETDPQLLGHNLIADGRLEAVEDFFFIGAQAGARMVGNNSGAGTIDAINLNADGTQSYSLRIMPEFRHHLGNYVDLVSRNAVDYVDYSGGRGANQDASNSTTLNLGLQSGTRFGPLSWNLDATQRETRYDDRTDENTSYTAGLGYRLNPKLSVNASAGYEENDVETNRTSDTDGPIWNVGAQWRPNPRTSVNASYGFRYIGNTYSGQISHRTRRTNLSLDFSRDITSRREQELVDSFFILVDNNGLPIIDPATGNFIVINIPQINQLDEEFVSRQVRGAISVNGRNTTVTLTGYVGTRDYEISPIDEDYYGGSVSVTRNLGSNYSASLRTGIRNTEDGPSGDTDNFDVQFSLIRNLSSRTSASIDFLYRDQDAELSSEGYTEKRIGISLTTSFL